MTLWIGIDVSKATLAVHVLRQELIGEQDIDTGEELWKFFSRFVK